MDWGKISAIDTVQGAVGGNVKRTVWRRALIFMIQNSQTDNDHFKVTLKSQHRKKKGGGGGGLSSAGLINDRFDEFE